MSNLDDKIEKIKRVSSDLEPVKEIVDSPESKPMVPNKDYFESLMQQGRQVNSVAATETPTKTSSLMDEITKLNSKSEHFSTASPESIKARSESLIKQIDSLKEQLNTPGLEIKKSVQTIFRNKLSHIDDNLKIALSKVGIEYNPTDPTTNTDNPIKRFLGFLTNGQYQLEHLSDTIDQLQLKKVELTPANMLAMQINISAVQQELEFFTSALSKSLESIKTLMNTQV